MSDSNAGWPGGADAAASEPVTLPGLRRALTSRSVRIILAVTLLLGMLTAAALVAGLPAADRTLGNVATPVQSLMSIPAPFLGVLLTTTLRRAHQPTLAPALLAALALGGGIALFGVAASAVAVTASTPTTPGRWQHTGAVILGCVVVQVIAQLVGTGLGLLIRRPVVACIATIVLPLGLWLILSDVKATQPASDWLTPYAGVGRLTAGQVTQRNWLQALVVFLIWGVGLNVLGATRLGRAEPRHPIS